MKTLLSLALLMLTLGCNLSHAAFPGDEEPSSLLPSGTKFYPRRAYVMPETGRLIYKRANELVQTFESVGPNDYFCAVYSPGGQVLEAIQPWWMLVVDRVETVRNAFIRIWTNNTNGYEVEFRCAKGKDDIYFTGVLTIGELKEVLVPFFDVRY